MKHDLLILSIWNLIGVLFVIIRSGIGDPHASEVEVAVIALLSVDVLLSLFALARSLLLEIGRSFIMLLLPDMPHSLHDRECGMGRVESRVSG